jgi:hypothetical protein
MRKTIGWAASWALYYMSGYMDLARARYGTRWISLPMTCKPGEVAVVPGPLSYRRKAKVDPIHRLRVAYARGMQIFMDD